MDAEGGRERALLGPTLVNDDGAGNFGQTFSDEIHSSRRDNLQEIINEARFLIDYQATLNASVVARTRPEIARMLLEAKSKLDPADSKASIGNMLDKSKH